MGVSFQPRAARLHANCIFRAFDAIYAAWEERGYERDEWGAWSCSVIDKIIRKCNLIPIF